MNTIHPDAIDDYLHTLTYSQLVALRDAADTLIQRRRGTPPADARERTGRGRMFPGDAKRGNTDDSPLPP